MADFTDNVQVLDSDDQTTILLDAANGNFVAGGNGVDGDLVLHRSNATGTNVLFSTASIHLDAENGNAELGGGGADGDVVLFPAGVDHSNWELATIHLNSGDGNVELGGNGVDGDIVLFPADVNQTDWSQATIHLDGASGDILLSNGDCAEDFNVAATDIEAGDVVVIGEQSSMRKTETPYDKRVSGVVSGAGDTRPGIILGHQRGLPDRVPIALIGRVCCKVDATYGAIEVGDLLTSSKTPGYAMRASDRERAFGSVLGKALDGLDSGRGLIPILVALQ